MQSEYTPVCKKRAEQKRKRPKETTSSFYFTKVVACSTDSHFAHLAWINTPRNQGGLGGLDIPLLSDLTGQISRNYGVLWDGHGIAFRGLFIIDAHGKLRHGSINDLQVGRCPEETLRLVQVM